MPRAVKGSPEAHAAAERAAETRRTNTERNAAKLAEGKRWAREFDACIRCGLTDSPHRTKGVCERCSLRERAPFRAGNAKLSAAQARKAKAALAVPIIAADYAAGRFLPQQWPAEDRLAKDETVLLVDAIYAELDFWAPNTLPGRLLVFLSSAAEQGVHLQLGMALGMIALPRLVRRGLVPPDAYLALLQLGILAQQQQPDAATAGSAAAPVESGPAPVAGGYNRNGQEHASGMAA